MIFNIILAFTPICPKCFFAFRFFSKHAVIMTDVSDYVWYVTNILKKK